MKRFYYIIFFAFILIGCSNNINYKIDDKTYRATGKNQRIQFIVIHYTAGSNEISLDELQSGRVSSHYLILSEKDAKKESSIIYNLVPENERAWHAGISSFRGRTNLNDTSIGIEIVSDGIKKEYWGYDGYHPYEHYEDFEEFQINKVIFLLKKIINEYNIPARNIVAHSDIAPSRKTDPGAKFPWKMLYEKYGIGAWYEKEDKDFYMNIIDFKNISIQDIKKELRTYGYEINNTNEWDKASRDVIYAFQLHFNPKKLTGEMDLETYSILKALNKKYVN